MGLWATGVVLLVCYRMGFGVISGRGIVYLSCRSLTERARGQDSPWLVCISKVCSRQIVCDLLELTSPREGHSPSSVSEALEARTSEYRTITKYS